MCGIFGFVVTPESHVKRDFLVKALNELFILSESRGKESSGIAVKNPVQQSIFVLKQPTPASKFIKTKEYDKFLNESLSGIFQMQNGLGLNAPFGVIAHARLVTNGGQDDNENNQPVIKNGTVGVHNGIIVNVDELWKKYSHLKRIYQVDTEIFLDIFSEKFNSTNDMEGSVISAFNEIYGAASVALLNNNTNTLVLATNTGSLYYIANKLNNILIFASENYILKSFSRNIHLQSVIGDYSIEWLKPYHGVIVDYSGNEFLSKFNFTDQRSSKRVSVYSERDKLINLSGQRYISNDAFYITRLNSSANEKLLEYNLSEISHLRRCSKCLLPETFPFIEYDKNGVCNYCHSYVPIRFKGEAQLDSVVEKYKSSDGNPDCIVTFSGGRDSSFGLHYVKQVLKMNPIAYTYDWGMVTDLARRNQARICGKLGIEHILISADINKKRDNIRKNVSAWLKRPHLGTIPLFMAGDKQYFYYANQLSKINKISLVVLCENKLETTSFKTGFCGIRPNFGTEHTYTLNVLQKLKMLFFYAREYAANPSYINSSIIDTLDSFRSYYLISHDYLNLFDYLKWDELVIEKTLRNEYDWELSPDTITTWRIGDGTAAFYNYIYYTVAGFSEFDTFRSNQIREGMLSRDEALQLVNQENKPRYESVKWYLDTIHLDFDDTIKRINQIPKLYRK